MRATVVSRPPACSDCKLVGPRKSGLSRVQPALEVVDKHFFDVQMAAFVERGRDFRRLSAMAYSRLLRCGAIAASALWLAQPAVAKPPVNWDGLAQVPARQVDFLYLRPGADFRPYRAIVLDPTQVAFRKNWQRDINQSRRGASRVTDADVRRAIDEAQDKLRSAFERRFRETGFQIVEGPAENALRVFVGVSDVDVAAPDIRAPGRSRVYSRQANRATLVVEVRDSLSGELLGRAVDHGAIGDRMMTLRTSASNRADFEALFDEWARISARGFQKLIAEPPATGK